MSKSDEATIKLTAAAFLFAAVGTCSIATSEATEFSDTIVVEKTWTKMSCDGDGKCSERYLVRSAGGEVFEGTYSLYRRQFRSSDVWSQMSPGETYDIEGDGYRMGCSSSYRNIYSAQEVK